MDVKFHPIQLQFVAVRELFIQTFFPPSPTYVFEMHDGQMAATTAKFDSERKTVQIGLVFNQGMDREPTQEEIDEIRKNSKQPFRLRVHLVAEFQVDTDKFPEDKIDKWGKANAPALLFPFLREQVFSLTARCGYNPVILPMIILPTFKLEAPKVEKSAEALAEHA